MRADQGPRRQGEVREEVWCRSDLKFFVFSLVLRGDELGEGTEGSQECNFWFTEWV